jgi:hypothetical protein
MNTNIKITLTDEQRRQLQQQLTGHVRPVTRQELNAFVMGAVMGAMDCEKVTQGDTPPCFSPRPDLSKMPARWAKRYADQPEHWKRGWLRGWNMVGEGMLDRK